MIHQCSNNRRLIISNKNCIRLALRDDVFPSVVLLTARSAEQSLLDFWNGLIRFFLERRCTHFVCAGEYSEALHDAIDDFLYQYDEQLGSEISKEIVTTYHADESIDDVVDFFVRSTEIRDKKNGYLIAVLDEGEVNDGDVIRCLLAS